MRGWRLFSSKGLSTPTVSSQLLSNHWWRAHQQEKMPRRPWKKSGSAQEWKAPLRSSRKHYNLKQPYCHFHFCHMLMFHVCKTVVLFGFPAVWLQSWSLLWTKLAWVFLVLMVTICAPTLVKPWTKPSTTSSQSWIPSCLLRINLTSHSDRIGNISQAMFNLDLFYICR